MEILMVFPRFLLLVAWGGCLLWLSLTSAPPVFPPVFGWDKLQHAAAFAVFTFLAGGAFTRITSLAQKRWGIAAFFAIIFGGIIEILQMLLTSTRRAEFSDLLADVAGAGIVYIAAKLRKPQICSHFSLVFMLILLAMHSSALAEDENANVAATVKGEIFQLRDEGLDVLKTPLDTERYGLIGTLAVGGAVGLTYLFDEDIREKVQANRSCTLDTAADIGAIVGNPLLHLGIAGAVYGGGLLADSPKWRETGAMLGEAALLADATSFVLKQAIGRGRPFAVNDKGSFRPFQFKSDYDSLPSMHAASSFAMASVLSSTTENIGTKLLYYTAATFIGFSRIYEDKHWASDIILGAAVGELCGRVVTKYHPSRFKMAVMPVFSGNSAAVGLVWTW